MVDQVRTRLGVVHLAAVGAATAAVLYALCWIAAALGYTAASHLYLSLFTTTEPATSLAALLQGVCLSLGFGAVTGVLVALFANLFGFLAPR
ncbi:MAG: hypothetical protein IV086_17855 [Hyphomonadaceae bacterium]|nr:hypothetical protein [Hyphomonadaceae bacterium]